MKTITLSILALVITLGCTQENDNFSQIEARAEKDYKRYKQIARAAERSRLTLYEGLPHQTWESELLDREKKRTDLVEVGDHYFYDVPRRLGSKSAEQLLAIMLDPDSFRPYGGAKLCGGYHPDYDLVITSHGTEYHVQVCFGCHEIKIISDNEALIMDMAKGTHERLKSVLLAYHQHRPVSEYFPGNPTSPESSASVAR